jgi:lysine methyltransferase
MPALSRAFTIPTSSGESFTLTLHEPTLTSDNLGTKTWVSSYLLSRRLHSLLEATPTLVSPTAADQRERSLQRVLELGAGTGLVGLSFAALRPSASVHLTDLPEIVPNLAYNVTLNAELLSNAQATVTTGVLDWSVPSDPLPVKNEKYDIILSADPLYSSEHPKWLAETIDCWLSRKLDSRVIVEMPLRDAYLPQVQEFRHRMIDIGLVAIENGQEVGHDDWENADGEPLEVICWWSVWAWSEKIQ